MCEKNPKPTAPKEPTRANGGSLRKKVPGGTRKKKAARKDWVAKTKEQNRMKGRGGPGDI